MKKAIVFGGSGFLGSYVADELTSRMYETTIADLQESKYLNGFQKHVQCDILDKKAVYEAICGFDYVYNFAAVAEIGAANNNPLKTIEVNVLGNQNILEACKNANVKRFVFASSAYAFNSKGSFYGISKHTSEKLTEEYGYRFKIPFSIIRYGSLYGNRASDENYIYSTLKEAILTKKLILKGGGNETREYIHALDAAKLSVDILEDEQFTNSHLTLTGLERLKRKDLLVMIREILNDEVDILNETGCIDGHYLVTPYEFQPTMSKKLVANPFIDMGQGLVECVKEIYKELNRANFE